MGVELFLAVVAKSSMLANLTHTDIVLLHTHTTHTHTNTHTHTHTHIHTHTQGISDINSTEDLVGLTFFSSCIFGIGSRQQCDISSAI